MPHVGRPAISLVVGVVLASASCNRSGARPVEPPFAAPSETDTASSGADRVLTPPPSVRIFGGAALVGSSFPLGSHLWNVGDTSGDGSDDLAAWGGTKVHVMPGGIANGEYEVGDVATGGLLIDDGAPGYYSIARAGDTDGDGYGDIWGGSYLYRGPFDTVRHFSATDAAITSCATAPVGNFDANGDGHLDMAIAVNSTAELYYGPFDGVMPGACDPEGGEPIPHTTFNGYTCDVAGVEIDVAYDLLGPGHHALLVGEGEQTQCGGDSVFVFDLMQAPGQRLLKPDAHAVADFSFLRSLNGDFNGDGNLDLWHGWAPLLGPVRGQIGIQDRFNWLAAELKAAPGDVDGDGLADVAVFAFDNTGSAVYLVLGGDYPDDMVVQDEAWFRIMDLSGDFFAPHNMISGDFDGDGLGDIVAAATTDAHPDGEIQIWYARDLLAWAEAQGLSR